MIQINRNPSRRQLRLFAALVFPAFWGLVAVMILVRGESPRIAAAVAAVAGLISAAGLFSPPFMRLVYLGMIYVTYPIGFVMSHLLLATIYYLVMTPIGLAMRLLGRDPMKRDFDRSSASYWIDKDEVDDSVRSDTDRYFRQY